MAKKLSPEWFQAQGKRGGKTRARNLTKAQRSALARKAARARWAKKEDK